MLTMVHAAVLATVSICTLPITRWAPVAAPPSTNPPAATWTDDDDLIEPEDLPPPGHREMPEQPPAAPARRPWAPRATAAPRVGPYRSIQVNVDAQGRNIVGDAANESTIAVDPTNPDRIVVGWRQFDTIQSNFRQGGWAYSHDGGQSWNFPGVLEAGVFRSDPVLDVDSEGNFYFASLKEDYSVDLFRSVDGGQTWPAYWPAYGGDKQWMTIDRTGGQGNGNIYVSWQRYYNCCGNRTFTRSTDGGFMFMNPVSMPNAPMFGTIAVGPDGEVYVAGILGNGQVYSQFRVAKSTNARNPAATPSFTTTSVNLDGAMVSGGESPNPGGLLGQVWVAVNPATGALRGHVYVLCSVARSGDPMDVMLARSTDGGATWQAPVRVNDDPLGNYAWQWFGALAAAPNGRVDAAWFDTRDQAWSHNSALYYASSFDDGQTWSRNVRVSPSFDPHVGYPQQNKMGDYISMIADEAGARLAYAATFNGEEDVYYIRVGDCNGNGVHDALDIANQVSADLNQNGIPDECEDCNHNSVPDDWDIANGTSADCNGNGIPDECDLASGDSPDCNQNGIPDECDVTLGTSPDCNANRVPDECDVANGTSPDCDANGVPDECDLRDPNRDCNHNGVLDDCDIAAGTSQDCQPNGRPDECDLAASFAAQSGVLSPLGGVTQTLLLVSPPDAADNVMLAFNAYGDLNYSNEYVDVDVNGTEVGRIYTASGFQDCTANQLDTLLVPASVFNAARAGGNAAVNMVPSSAVDPAQCQGATTYIQVSVSYAAVPHSQDTNGNGIPDECEAPRLCRGDCDCNGQVGFGDIDYFVAAIPDNAAGWAELYAARHGGQQPPCGFANCDVTGDGHVNFADIDPFVALVPSSCP